MEKSIANIILQSNRNEIKKLENLLIMLNENYHIDADRFCNFQIAASEALINAIIHGNKESEEKRIYVDIYDNEKYFILRIKDEGEGFNLNKLPDPTDNENLIKEHGRGVFIMKQLTDEYDCRCTEHGTLVELKIKKTI